METNKKIMIFIAAFNEERAIEAAIDDVLTRVPLIVVVDDGSSDTTYQKALEKGVIVLRHPINRGKGAAIRTVTEYALNHEVDILIHFDADGQHHAFDIQNLVAPIIHGNMDVVLGSRFLHPKDSNVPFWRKTMLRAAVLFTWFFSGLKLSDTHNGLRAFNRTALEQICIFEDRFAYASEILDEIARLKLRYCEVPVTITYTEYSRMKGQSTWNALYIVHRLLWRKFFLK